MKLIHLSDLHLGKRVNEFSMLEDQKDILNKIIAVIEEEQPDAVLIAGDVYDKSVPSAEAVELFDEFLVQLANTKTQVFIISGNHDSAERLAFANRLIDASGIHLAPVYRGEVAPFSFKDEYGTVDLYMLPFVKPANVRRFFPEEEIRSYEDALKAAICAMQVNEKNRSILITHQFVTGALVSDSEDLSVGGTDQVSAEVFEAFDYVALGHLHRPQNVKENIRYCGTPLKYSFSEAKHEKSVTVIELTEKGNLSVRTVPLHPMRDMREIEGTYEELTYRPNYEGTNTEDYLHITLTDEEDIPDAIGKLRLIYPCLMCLDYNNSRTRAAGIMSDLEDVENKSPLILFEEFYEQQNGRPMSDEQKGFALEIMESIWEPDTVRGGKA